MSKKLNIAITVMVILPLLLFIILLLASTQNVTSKEKETVLTQVHLTGKYSIDGNPWQNYDSTFDSKCTSLHFKGHFTENIPKGELLILYPDNISVTMRINGNIIYQFGEPGSYPSFSKLPGSDIFFYKSPGIKTTDTIEFQLETNSKIFGAARINKLFTMLSRGYAYELYDRILTVCVLPLIIGISIVFIGLVIFILFMILRDKHKDILQKGLSLAFFSCVCGLYLIVDSCYLYLPLILKNPVMCNIVDVGLLFLFIPTCCFYFYNNLNQRARIMMAVVTALQGFISTAAFTILFLGIPDIYELQTYVIIIGIFAIFFGMLCLGYEGFGIQNRNARFVFLSFLPISLAAMIDISNALYPFMPKFLLMPIGIMITILLQVYRLVFYIKLRYAEILKQQEMTDSRIKIMLSQIQPHFLYNTLNSISALCEIDSNKAIQLVYQFSQFLRGNLDSLTITTPIPFIQEKNHLEIYLAIEKTRFGDILNIEYDFWTFDFCLPALTLQLIVQNAVRHGITKKKGGGTVKISSWETKNSYILQVTDNGIGFSLENTSAEGRSPILFEAVANRLKIQCNGSLVMESNDGISTTITISIPKKVSPK